VKKLLSVCSAAVAMLSLSCNVLAQSPNDLAEIRAQLRGLMQRVDKLEQENTTLKTENATLRAQGESLQNETRSLRRDTASVADAVKTKGPDWTSRIAFKGDLRYRYEFVSDETNNAMGVQAVADRYRDRIRARLSLDAKVNDDVTVGVGFSSGENGDPRSTNQSLTGTFTRKALDLDLAYLDWKFASFGNLIAGKMRQPFYKPAQTFYFDNDVTPEGVAATFNRGRWFGSAFGYFINEVSGAENTRTADTMLYGAQVGTKLAFGSNNLTLSAMYYDLAAAKGRAPFFANNSNGNTTVSGVLRNDYRVIDMAAEYTTKLGSWPLVLWTDMAQNQGADDLDEAFSGGVIVGKAANPGSLEFSVGAESVKNPVSPSWARSRMPARFWMWCPHSCATTYISAKGPPSAPNWLSSWS